MPVCHEELASISRLEFPGKALLNLHHRLDVETKGLPHPSLISRTARSRPAGFSRRPGSLDVVPIASQLQSPFQRLFGPHHVSGVVALIADDGPQLAAWTGTSC